MDADGITRSTTPFWRGDGMVFKPNQFSMSSESERTSSALLISQRQRVICSPRPVLAAMAQDFATTATQVCIFAALRGSRRKVVEDCEDEFRLVPTCFGRRAGGLVVIDAIVRCCRVRGKRNLAVNESFSEGLLDYSLPGPRMRWLRCRMFVNWQSSRDARA